jgi:hypothetical protein
MDQLSRTEDRVWIHLLKPGEEYPSDCFKHRDALYYPSEEVVFIATKETSYHVSEVAIWRSAEVRLLGTLALSIPEGGRRVTFIPWGGDYVPELTSNSDLSSKNVIHLCAEFAKRLRVLHEESNQKPYVLFNAQRSDTTTEHQLYENIDLEWGLLMRGLYTLLKSQIIIHTDLYICMEEAFMNLQISREAAIQIICEHLRCTGNPKATTRDVYDYIRSNFVLGAELAQDLELQNESWIETKHPRNPFAEDYAPWLIADDVFEPYDALISIYRHIVLGEPGGSSMLT